MAESKFTIEFVGERKEIPPEFLIYCLLGCSVQELIDDIAENKDGKWDDLYNGEV